MGQSGADFAGNPACTAICDDSVGVDGAEIPTDGDIAVAHFHVNPKGFQNAATDLELKWIVSEQGQVARAGAVGHTSSDRCMLTGGAFGSELIEVRSAGCFQFGLSTGSDRQAAQAVGHKHDNLGAVLLFEVTDQVLETWGHSGRSLLRT